jgi:MFS family permease
VALLGLWTQNTAAQLVILSLTSSAFLIGMINIVSAVPLLLLSLLGGVVADRHDRRKIIMSTQAVIAGLSAVWAVLIVTDTIAYWHVLVLAAIGGTIVSFDLPAGQAFLAQLVRREDMPEAIAINSASINATRSFGPALAGLVIGAFGTAVAFASHTLALLVFVAVIFSLHALLPKTERKPATISGVAALKAGLSHIRKSDDLLGLVGTTALFSFLAVPSLLVLMPLYVTKVLGGGDGWVPAMTSVFGLGSLVAAITMFRSSRHELAAGRRLRLTAFGLSAGLLWLALSPNPWAAIPGVLISGCAFELGLIQIQTRLQQLTPDDMRGRVLSVNGLAFNGVMPFATLSISAASEAIGLPLVTGFCASVLAVGSFFLWKRYTWKAFVPPPTS